MSKKKRNKFIFVKVEVSRFEMEPSELLYDFFYKIITI